MVCIAACCMTLNRFEELKKCVERVTPAVDHFIVVEGGSTDGTVEWLKTQPKVEIIQSPWSDDFSAQRTMYLRAADKYAPCWIAVMDTDELYSEGLVKDLRSVVTELDRCGFDMIGIQSESVVKKVDGTEWRRLDDFRKGLIFKWSHGIQYVGNPHEDLRGPTKRLDIPYTYEHIKYEGDIQLRGVRNFFIGGKGCNGRGPVWEQFRQLCSVYGYQRWLDLERDIIKGRLPEEIVQWAIDHRNDEGEPGDSEVRAVFVSYLVFLHPTLNVNKINNFEFSYNYKEVSGV